MEVESNNLPEFFKVYITSHSSNKMLIPSEFVDYLGWRQSGLAELSGPSGQTWRVELVYDGTNLYFTDGWIAFVKDNLVRDGDFLFFKFHGNLKFSFMIYDESMCEKQSVFVDRCRHGRDGIPEAKEKRNAVKAATRRSVRPYHPKAERIAMSGKPVFQKCITASNGNLSLPTSFVQEHSLSYKSYETMVLRTSRNTNSSWEVNILNNRGLIILSGGWRDFARENCINARDVCIFELVDRLEMIVHVALTGEKGSGKKR